MKIELDKDNAAVVKECTEASNKTPDVFANEALRMYFNLINLPVNTVEKIIGIIDEHRNK